MLTVSKFNRKYVSGIALSAACVLASSNVVANIIDATYGVGAGSFELGDFVTNGFGFMELAPGATTITGWSVGGPGNGVDWLTTPSFGARSGLHSVDLVRHTAGSVSTEIPTTVGQTYQLSFYTATVSTGASLGTVSAGSLVSQTFSAPITPGPDFASQAFAPFSFLFTANGSKTTVSFTSASGGCLPDCYGPVIDSVSVDSTVAVDGGIIAPGGVDPIGKITIGGDLTFKKGAKYLADLDLAGLKSDYLGVDGTLNLGTDSLLDLNLINDLLLDAGKEFQIVGYGGSDGNYFKGFADGSRFNRGQNRWEIDYRPGGIYLTSLGAAAVPEPSSLALLLLAGGLLGARRRRH